MRERRNADLGRRRRRFFSCSRNYFIAVSRIRCTQCRFGKRCPSPSRISAPPPSAQVEEGEAMRLAHRAVAFGVVVVVEVLWIQPATTARAQGADLEQTIRQRCSTI